MGKLTKPKKVEVVISGSGFIQFFNCFFSKVLSVVTTNNSIITFQGGELMAKCPKCGKEVALKKSWKMAGRPDKSGKRMELTIGLSECCGQTFRTVLSKQKI